MGPAPVYAPHNGGFPPTSFPVRDSSTRDFVMRTERSNSTAAIDPSQVQRPTKMQASGSYAQFDNRPMMLDKSGRPSSSSSNASSIMSKDSFDSRMRSPASTRTSFESWTTTPSRMDYGWQRPAPMKQFRKKAQPGELFAALPGEVLELILDQLRKLHLDSSSTSCATCMMRDLCSVAVSARKLSKFARAALYENIELVGNDSPVQKKKFKINHGSRLTLLRRTLRSNPQIAAIVHSLKAPATPQGMPLDEYQSLVASVIMACPNFERLHGPHPKYNHNFNRLFYALSTRDRLKEMNWIVDASPFQRQRRFRSVSNAGLLTQAEKKIHASPGDLQPQQSEAFLELNVHWSHLTTLTIHCLPGATLTPLSLLGSMLSYMPSLQNLYLSHLPFTSFNDASLLSLPSLKTLSLSHLPGITTAGLSSFATRYTSKSIRKLILQHVNVDSLPALARIMSNLISLETFALVQSITPILPEDEMIWLFPYLASGSLRKLHWDITSHPTCVNMADSILAKSIAAYGFPALRILRTPNDPEGIFQNLCKPVEKIEKASDKYRGRGPVGSAGSTQPGTPSSMNSPDKFPQQFLDSGQPRECSHLAHSRMAAQNRLDSARRFPRYFVNVIDEDGTVVEKWGMAGFMGRTESNIWYCVQPDAGASDENGGLVQLSDTFRDGGEDLKDREGCSGRWNAYSGNTQDKRDRDRWWHSERGRWKGVSVSQ